MQFVLSAVLLMLAGALWYIGWQIEPAKGFPIAIAVSAPLIGLAAVPLIGAASSRTLRLAKEIAYRDVEGRHYAYKGRSIRVHEDLVGDRWLCVRDIRKIIKNLPRDEVWAKMAPDDLGRIDARKELFLRAQALDHYLSRNQDDVAVRFRNWLDREVILPAQRGGELGLARSATREHTSPGQTKE